jgi:2-aminobenzoate-CoA ligase
MTPLARTGYADTFARDNLPPAAHWPVIEFTTDRLKYPERLNAAAEIIDVPNAAYGPDRPALKTPDGAVWTYGELRTRANQIARVLTEDLGLVTGNRVLLRSPNNPWTVAAWLGVLKAGGIVVTTMAALRARELGPIVAKTRPSIALVDHRCTDVHALAGTTAPGLKVVAYGGDAAASLATSRPPTRRPTTWRCSVPRLAAPAYPRSPPTSTATCCRSTTPSARRRCGCGRRTWSRALPRSRSRSASGC